MRTSQVASMDRSYANSVQQKLVFSALHLSSVVFCLWLVAYGGLSTLGEIIGQRWLLADHQRAWVLLACAVLYWVRHNLTLFYLLKRRVGWSEVLGLSAFIAAFEIGLLLVGGGAFDQQHVALGWPDVLALLVLLGGSLINSLSEVQRHRWKAHRSNRGHCYTGGLFRYSTHINYFGDTVLFTGWCLLSAHYAALLLPVFMAGTFVAVHIPGLDRHLAQRYGDEFAAYSKITKKFVPFIY